MVFGKLPRGPLAVLKGNWTGHTDPPLSFGQTTAEYLEELRNNLKIAETYVHSHAQRTQQKYVSRYNLRSREKSFLLEIQSSCFLLIVHQARFLANGVDLV